MLISTSLHPYVSSTHSNLGPLWPWSHWNAFVKISSEIHLSMSDSKCSVFILLTSQQNLRQMITPSFLKQFHRLTFRSPHSPHFPLSSLSPPSHSPLLASYSFRYDHEILEGFQSLALTFGSCLWYSLIQQSYPIWCCNSHCSTDSPPLISLVLTALLSSRLSTWHLYLGVLTGTSNETFKHKCFAFPPVPQPCFSLSHSIVIKWQHHPLRTKSRNHPWFLPLSLPLSQSIRKSCILLRAYPRSVCFSLFSPL